MKRIESSCGMFAVIEGIETRLSKRSRVKNKDKILDGIAYSIDRYGLYRDNDGVAITIPQHIQKIEKMVYKKGYDDYDVDTKEYALVKCYKNTI